MRLKTVLVVKFVNILLRRGLLTIQVKLGILNLLSNSDIPIDDKYVHYVIASIDTNVEVAEFGKQQIKNFQGYVIVEILKRFWIYLS